jgi:uncharacterized protein YuzB (UPF0349 family)
MGMKPIIEFCVNNIVSCSRAAAEKLEKDRSLDVVITHCLGHCSKCLEEPFALVNRERVWAESSEQLVDKIYKFMVDYDIV